MVASPAVATVSWSATSLGSLEGGPIGLLEEGDTITIDADKNEIFTDADLSPGSQTGSTRTRYTRGVLAKYAKLVTSASEAR